ncbi:signal transducer and activator of transcription 2-like, partial [Malurus melanocephalus]|uniref:signal transducer and activator of transcription 2-like n=1 Tax=Malurus melanocephalus TaxID=175006 RepID=UPI002547E946
MAQWQEVQNLANTYLEQVHQLYAGSALPMAVRQCLAAWIEGQNWRQAAEPLSSHARMLFHSLLVLLGESLGSLGSGHEDFMLKHNLRKAHRDLQSCHASATRGVPNPATPCVPPIPPDPVPVPGEDRTRDPQHARQLQALQSKLQSLDRQRREVLAQLQQLLGRSETLGELLQEELGRWRERQRRHCLGGPGDSDLRPLETCTPDNDRDNDPDNYGDNASDNDRDNSPDNYHDNAPDNTPDNY